MRKKISIIIPVYNTEQYFDRCIRSVLNQSYENLEILVVNDGSPGNIAALVNDYPDPRIKTIPHERNKGLYCARVTGMLAATGDYVAFLDSDDYVSFDFYRVLLERAEEVCADIVIGKTVWEQANRQYVFNLHDGNFQFDVLEMERIREAYFSQEASCYSWHTVWNKLYRKDLIDRCLPSFSALQDHIIMTEDICFSSILFYKASRLTKVNESAYFYCANEGASTNTDGISLKKYLKNVHDMNAVFNHVDTFLEQHNATDEIRAHFANARKHYARMWQSLLDRTFNGQKKIEAQAAINEFCSDFNMDNLERDFFFESIQSPWCGAMESFKEQLFNGQEQYISFDIFDTLIMRPFYAPEDLLELLSQRFTSLTGSNASFTKMRQAGERYAREQLRMNHPEFQDVTLTEIYNCIEELFGLSSDITAAMQMAEIELELRFCKVRPSGKALFNIAKAAGKKILVVSDMYLEEDTIRELLEINGFSGYEKLYLSSAQRKLKYSGDLFRCVLQDYADAVGNMIHIGDTWVSDIEGSQKAGVDHFFLPKVRDFFESKINGYQTNRCATIAESAMGTMINPRKVSSNIGYRAMQALAAGKYFEHPYRPFNSESDFNADPWFIGYYAVGMHLMGLCKWMHQEISRRDCKTIHFLSRDGYLPMKAFEIYNRYVKSDVKISYLQTSRKALLPMIVRQKVNFYQLPVEYRAHTPESLLKLLSFASKEMPCEEVAKILKTNGINATKTIESETEYYNFIRCFLNEFYSEEKHIQACSVIEDYFAQIQPGDVAFDMGYSGRIQAAISDACRRGVDVLFVHEDYDTSIRMKPYGQFNINAFYDFRPSVSGLFREHILSDYNGSCIGYRVLGGKAVPIIENTPKYYTDTFIINSLHNGALQFVEDFMSQFGDNLEAMDYSAHEVSLPFEGFLRNFSTVDLKIFGASYFEDEVYGGKTQINVEAFLQAQTNELNGVVAENFAKSILSGENSGAHISMWDAFEYLMCRRPLLIRALVWLLLDFDLFKKKMKNNLKSLKNGRLFS